MEYPKAKKTWIRWEEIALAVYFPSDEYVPAHIEITLKSGVKHTVNQDDERFEEYIEMIF